MRADERQAGQCVHQPGDSEDRGRSQDAVVMPAAPTDDIEGGGGGPRWRDTIVLMLVAALIAGAGVYWWQQRSPNPGRTDVGFYDDMTTHHLQAIAMSNAYIRNGRSPFLSQEAGEVSL